MSRTDQSSRVIAATPQDIYTAMTSPEALATWLPPADMSGSMLAFDLRIGGHYRMALRYADTSLAGKAGGNEDIAEAHYRDLVPDRLVLQEITFPSDDPAFAGTMLMHWIIEEQQDGTRVTIRAENVPEGISAEDHAMGLASSLENLARYVETKA